MKKRILFFLISCFQLLWFRVSAQYFISADKNYVYETDTCTIHFTFGNATFSKFVGFYASTIGLQTTISSSPQVKVLNDSVLQVKIPPQKLPAANDSLFIYISCTDPNLEQRNLLNKFPVKIIRYIQSSQYFCYNSNIELNTDTLQGYFKITLASRGTHFKEADTKFGIERQFMSNFTPIDSVEVLSDTLVNLFLVLPFDSAAGTIGIQYRNKRDGIIKRFSQLTLYTNQYIPDGILLSNYVFQKSIVTAQDTVCSVVVSLHENDYFNPDTLQHAILPALRLETENGNYISNNFPVLSRFDSFPFTSGGSKYQHQAQYSYAINISATLATGNYHMRFQHPQLPAVMFPYAINITRPQVILSIIGVAYPGMTFQVIISDPYKALLNRQIQIQAPAGSGISIDSFNLHLGEYYIYGHTDALCMPGKYTLTITDNMGSVHVIENAIMVSNEIPILLRFLPNNIVCSGRTDSTKSVYSNYISVINNNQLLPPIRVLKNGSLYTAIQIAQRANNNWNIGVTIAVADTVTPGWYDAEIYDSLSQQWYLQKNALYVVGAARAVSISPDKVAIYDVGYRQFTGWFKQTHFTQAKEIRIQGFFNPQVINDTCLTFTGRNEVPQFYNDADGYIGNEFNLKYVSEPSITGLYPNWIARSTSTRFTVFADVSSWLSTQEGLEVFIIPSGSDLPQEMIHANNLVVLNDTAMQFDLDASDSVKTGYYKLVVFDTENFWQIISDSIVRVIPTGLNDLSKQVQSTPLIYPNPSDEWLTVKVFSSDFTQIEILDVYGNTVYSGKMMQQQLSLNMHDIVSASGVYLIRLSGTSVYTQKIFFKP